MTQTTPEQNAFLAIQRTGDLLLSQLNRALKPHDLSSPLFNVLRILRGACGDGLSCGEIADRMVHRDPDVTRLVDRLEKRGLVTRGRDAADRRVVKVAITTNGRRLLRKLDRPVIELHARQLGHLGGRRLEQLTALLEAARRGPGSNEP